MIYGFLYVFSLIVFLFSLDRYYKKLPLAFVLLILTIFVVGLRYASIDYFSYQDVFNIINNWSELNIYGYNVSWSGNIEPGFAFFILLSKSLSINFYIFMFVFALVSISIKYVAFQKMSPYLSLSLIIYLTDNMFYKDLGQIRNAMATGIVLLSIYYLYKEKKLIFFTLITLAVSMHFLAILGYFLYFLKYFSSRKILILLFIFSIFITLGGGLGQVLASFVQLFNIELLSKVLIYQNSSLSSKVNFFGGTNLLQLLLVVLILYNYHRLIYVWKINILLIPMFIMGSSLMFIFIDFEIIWGRIRDMYTTPALAIILPSFVLLFNKNQKIIIYVFIILYSLLWFYLMIPHREDYQTILQFLF